MAGADSNASAVETIPAEVLDEGKSRRQLQGWPAKVTFALAVALSVFQLYTAAFGVLSPERQRGIHYAFILFLLFMFYPAFKNRSSRVPWYDILLAVVAVAINFYPIVFLNQIVQRAGDFSNVDGYVSIALLALTLEGARRVLGWPLVIIALAAVLYALFGYLIPGGYGHRGHDLQTIATHSVLTMEGVMGIPMAVASTFVFIFILFAAFLKVSGLGQFFIDLSIGLVGHIRGGPAQVAVISSGMLGTISGSSTANVVGTGTFTIPMMKALGYRPQFAGAVEAAASTGGQLMPPIMGAAAFIMAEVLGVPYMDIVVSAAIPAVLYYVAVALMIDKEAVKTGMRGIPRDQTRKLGKVVQQMWHMVLPLFVIIYVLVAGFTALFAGLAGVISCVAVSTLRRSTRMSVGTMVTALRDGAESAILITTACAACGIIIGVFTLTGVGLKFGYGIVELAGGLLFPTLVLTMLTSLILGMGIPTTANYIITATVAAPALIALGVTPIAAHLFVFYFGIVADITPPVAIAAYAAAAIAKADPIATGITAARLAIAAFIVPYFFIYNPYLLLLHNDVPHTVIAVVTALVGIYAIASAVAGHWRLALKPLERVLLFIAALALLDPGFVTDAIGLALMVIVRLLVLVRQRRRGTSTHTKS